MRTIANILVQIAIMVAAAGMAVVLIITAPIAYLAYVLERRAK